MAATCDRIHICELEDLSQVTTRDKRCIAARKFGARCGGASRSMHRGSARSRGAVAAGRSSSVLDESVAARGRP